MKVLEEALKKNKLTEFLLGEGKYNRKPPTEFGNEPNFYSYWWRNELEPYLNSEQKEKLIAELNKSFLELIKYSKDINLGIYTLLSHLVQYYYSLNVNKRITVQLDLTQLIPLIERILSSQKQSLLIDKRWTGQEGVSLSQAKGLWGIMLSCCVDIKRFGGPNLIPEGEEV